MLSAIQTKAPLTILTLVLLIFSPSTMTLAQNPPSDSANTAAVADSVENASQETAAATDQASSSTDGSAGSVADVGMFWPLFAMTLGVVVVLGLMIGLKTHAFIALILGALTISCFIPLDITGFAKTPEPHVIRDASGGAPVNIINRVTSSLGGAVVGIGVLIAMAAIMASACLLAVQRTRLSKPLWRP